MTKPKEKEEKKVLGDVKSFVVDCKTWYRGRGSNSSCMLNTNGKSCCLGFYARQCGVENKLMRKKATPLDVVRNTRDIQVQWDTKLIKHNKNSITCERLMETNDSRDLTEPEREKKLTALFKKNGIKVKFVGEKIK